MTTASIAWFVSPRARIGLLAASLASALLWPHVGAADTTGPFARFEGSWRGSGRVSGSDGKTERINCKASYSIPPSGASLSQSLICASDSYRFEVQSDVVVIDGHNVQGRWQEKERHADGDLVGTIDDGNFEGKVTGSGFTAGISLRMTGAKQAVIITPTGSNIVKVDIVMSHGK
jgi:hypothetical protein